MTATDPIRSHPPYPINLDLADQPVLVVGGGAVAGRKVRGLRECGAWVTVVAPTVIPEVARLIAHDPAVRHFTRPYRRGEAASYRVVIAATGVVAVDTQVAEDARATGIPVNAADDPEHCSFTLPAVARRRDIQVTVSTAGRSPALAAWLRDQIAATLDDSYLSTLELLSRTRREVQATGASTEGPAWRRALDAGLVRLVEEGRADEAEALLRAELTRQGLIDGTDLPRVGPRGGDR